MERLKQLLVLLLIILLPGGGMVYAYTAEVTYFFEGIDINTGEVYRDPTVLIIISGSDPTGIEEILRPPEWYPEFGEAPVDLFAVFDPAAGASLVFLPAETQEPDQIAGLIIGDTTINLPPDDYFEVAIGDFEIVTFLTFAGDFITTRLTSLMPNLFALEISDDPVIPEPATLALFSIGLLGLLGLRRKHKKGGKHGLLLALALSTLLGFVQPTVAQSFSCADVTEIPQTECEALVAICTAGSARRLRFMKAWRKPGILRMKAIPSRSGATATIRTAR